MANPYLSSSLDPAQEAGFTNRRSAIDQSYKTGLAQTEFSRAQSQQQFGMDRDTLLRQYQQKRQGIPQTFNRRNMLRSGLHQRAISTGALDQLRALAQQNLQQQGTLGQFDLSRQSAESDRATSLAGLDYDRMAQLAQLAAQLRGMQP